MYVRYSKRMLALCYRYTGSMDAAYDVLHDAFVKIYTRFSFRGDCSLDTWMTRVMVTQSIDYLRREQRFTRMELSDKDVEAIPDEAWAAEAGEGLSEEVLLDFVAGLPDGCRTVFNLYVFEGKSHKEIAQMLGIKEHSSTSQHHRAKCLLAERIKEYIKHERK